MRLAVDGSRALDALAGEEAMPLHRLDAHHLGAEREAQGIDGMAAEEPQCGRFGGPAQQLEGHE